ncbi:SAM-dependent methyltransferase [Martelella endophytica]|uniref:Cyclopropane-fatty-acyl-phospholipid synthase n=1 Tax=Martelella endophytica TaxID=1486262 RepID=A0A0D5LS25_MAREN|nr:cyclopropane-fatty-acyl-phospholipid synthase family protein [Martelella endophytica]AJY46582.1 cyclopropane-fatty-acyl-phospholipid synthase [Martelella endophytica]
MNGSKNEPKRDLNFWQRMVVRMASRIRIGTLTLHFPGGRSATVTGSADGPTAEITLRNARPLFRLMTDGDLGFARSYIDGDWESPDLSALLELAIVNEDHLDAVLSSSTVFTALSRFRHRLRRNTKSGSKRNIAFHYDLGNAFYERWLDETMTYSSALYEGRERSLSEAQLAKYDRIIARLQIGPEDRVLEIGCGWGGFAERAAAVTGCHVTGLTLSKEQAKYARERLAKKGLSDRADIRLEDYRDCTGTYDKIVSIEMFEAVGEENWPTFFDAVHDRLAPGGTAVIQSIAIEDHRLDHYRRNPDFIQAYIFPGGMLPSFESFSKCAGEAGLKVRELFAFGRDYARTLLEWEERFLAEWEAIRPLGFDDRFRRMWRYYLHYCASGFNAGNIDVAQFHLHKPAV